MLPDIMDELRVQTHLTRLGELPGVVEVTLHRDPLTVGEPRWDGILEIRTAAGVHPYLVEVKRTHLSRVIADGIIAKAGRRHDHPLLLLAPYVPPRIGQYLTEHGIEWLDELGNCHLELRETHQVHVEGRRPKARPPEARGLRAAGVRVLFALVAQPELLDAPLRRIAEAAGAGKDAARHLLRRLEAEGLVAQGRHRRRILDHERLMDRWLDGYATVLRPAILRGRFAQPQRDPEAVERAVEKALPPEIDWAWGGGTAAMILTGHYRGPVVTLHAGPELDVTRTLRAPRDDNGILTVLGIPGPLALGGLAPRTVHPVLIHAELMTRGDERAREAALELRQELMGQP